MVRVGTSRDWLLLFLPGRISVGGVGRRVLFCWVSRIRDGEVYRFFHGDSKGYANPDLSCSLAGSYNLRMIGQAAHDWARRRGY